MVANQVLAALMAIEFVVTLPLQIVVGFVLGFLANLTAGYVLIPFGWLRNALLAILLGLSWVTSRTPSLREPIGFLALPIALATDMYSTILPSFGDDDGRYAAMLLCMTWPFTWEYWEYDLSVVPQDEARWTSLATVLARIASNPVLKAYLDRRSELKRSSGSSDASPTSS